MNQEEYDKDLAERQKQHLECVGVQAYKEAEPCMHHQCSECVGTGVKGDGSPCVHFISCPCFRCTPRF